MKAITVTLILDVDSEAEGFDAANEILREQQRAWVATSCLIDYGMSGDACRPLSFDAATYAEGDAFTS